jgi:hypothetical protein
MYRSLLLVVLFVSACAKREESHDSPTPTATTADPAMKSKGGSMPVYNKTKVLSPMMPPKPPKSMTPDPLPAPAASASASK